MRLVPNLDQRIELLERRQRDRKEAMREVQELYDRKERELTNLKALRDAVQRGEESE